MATVTVPLQVTAAVTLAVMVKVIEIGNSELIYILYVFVFLQDFLSSEVVATCHIFHHWDTPTAK